MDPGILVPPKGYGGHERLVYMFAKEYTRLGHKVHLLVTKGSVVEDCIVYSLGDEGFPPKKLNALLAIPKAWWFLLRFHSRYDVIHNFGRLLYLMPLLNKKINKIMTYGREISVNNIRIVNRFPTKNLFFTGCSKNLVSRGSVSGKWLTIYNAIDFNKYSLNVNIDADSPLLFLGRIERVKGCHTAIKIALETRNKLYIAGNISTLKEELIYFKNEIEPYIDGHQIVYLGSLDDEKKNIYLGKAKALLFPIEWEEPFGIVMIEAMACGTPVLAYKRGSVPEIVIDGINGFISSNYEDLKINLSKITKIDRSRVRSFALIRFDVSVIAKEYLDILK
jgi:glycosyltransferase involved in cell wall biosynthesis